MMHPIANDDLLGALLAYASRQKWQLMVRVEPHKQWQRFGTKMSQQVKRASDLEDLFHANEDTTGKRILRVDLPVKVKLFLTPKEDHKGEKSSQISGIFKPNHATISNYKTAAHARCQGAAGLLMDIFIRLAHDIGLSTCGILLSPDACQNPDQAFRDLYRTHAALGFIPADGKPVLATCRSRQMILQIKDYKTSISLAVGKVTQVHRRPNSSSYTLTVHLAVLGCDKEISCQGSPPPVGSVVKVEMTDTTAKLYIPPVVHLF